MKISCPHCSQRISISKEIRQSLLGQPDFACPACGGACPTSLLHREDSLGGLAADQLLMRGANTPHFSGPGGWEPPEPEELAGLLDSRYEIFRILGRGGMGAVYQARDNRLGRLVAIKILPQALVDEPGALERFEREARALAALDHPHIVKIHDYGQASDGSPFIIMEFVRGRDIQSLRDAGELDLPNALRLISETCSALHYAHLKGIVHRDIKPANILVSEDGSAKVADFGLAKVESTHSRPLVDPSLTNTGQVMGTPNYMAPEQEAGEEADHRADIYALGVTLYNLLTGAPPRGAWSLPSHKLQIDVRLDEIVIKALQEKPEARYQAAQELQVDLDSVRSQTGGSALPPGVAPDPLPSSVGGARPSSHHSRAPARVRLTLPTAAQPDHGEILATTRSLNNTMLILGLLAIGVIGGLAIYLANRKTGDTYQTQTTISSSVTNNTFFTQIIAAGLATSADLAAIADIRPRGETLVGISKEPLAWNEARDLAAKIGATVLPIGNASGEVDAPLMAWTRENFASQLTSPVWVSSGDKPHLCGATESVTATDLAALHRVMFVWSLPKTTVQAEPTEPSPVAGAPEFTYTSQGASVTITGCKGATPEFSIPISIGGKPVTVIGSTAFQYNPVIRRVIIPETVVNIESYAFFGCEKLASVQIPASVLQIGGRAFGGCGELPAFDVAIANSSFKVMDGVLYSKDGLTLWQYPGGKGGKFVIPQGVTKIGGWAFSNSRLVEEIHVPAAITEINAEPFGSCGLLQRIEVSPENPLFSSRDGVFYNKDGSVILQYPGGRTGAFEIPPGVVGFDAVFAYADKLTRVTIPASVSRIGDNAFFACPNLARVDFAGDAPGTVGKNIFQGSSPGFKVFFQPGAKGFTTPLWNGYPCGESSEVLTPTAPSAPAGPPPWISTDGKTIQAEFVRLSGEAVVIRMESKEFTIPFSRLTPASIEQARKLAGQPDESP